MLTITPQASEAIRGILASDSVPEGSMLRISPQPDAGSHPQGAMVVSVTDSPPPDDQVVQGDRVEVSVERNTADILEEMELDAVIEGNQVSFTLAQRSD